MLNEDLIGRRFDLHPCGLCQKPTPLYYRSRNIPHRCDPCWELEGRIESNPDAAETVLSRVRKGEPRPITYT